MKTKDLIQIVLNLIAFFVLFFATGGKGSFWGFLTFNIIAGIILFELVISRDMTGLWVWITKTVTYVLFSIKFAFSMGPIKMEYVIMIAISVISLLISRHLIKKRSVALWGQNIAYLFGGYLYVLAILQHPQTFTNYHIIFWSINTLSYSLLVYDVIKNKKDKVNLIIPVYAIAACLVYIICIVAT